MRNYELSGYPVPSPLPTSYRCYVVRVPNAPECIEAFYNSWFSLSAWLAWEKDEGRTAVSVSKLFRAHKPIPIACDVVDELDEEGNMTINVTTNVTCNCGTCGTGGSYCIPQDDISSYDPTVELPSGGELDPTGPVPDEMSENHSDWVSYDSYICDVSWFIPELMARALRTIETFSDKLSTIAGVMSVITFIFPAAFVLKAGTVALIDLVTSIIEIFVGESLVDELLEVASALESEPLQSDIACAIYTNRYNLPIAHSQLLLVFSQYMTTTTFSQETRDKINGLLGKMVPARWLYYEMVQDVFADMPRGRDCSTCAGSQEDILIDFDNVNPPLTINILATSSIQDDGTGNLELSVVGHTTGNDGGGGWFTTDLLSLAGVASMSIYQVEYNYRTGSVYPTDDVLTFSLTGVADSFEYVHNPTTVLLTHQTAIHAIEPPIEMGTGQQGSIRFLAHPVEQRSGFRIDNIKIWFNEV